jgi:Protein of unknown function (DUF2939)
MRVTRLILLAVAAAGASYVAYPFVTIYQIRCAVRGGDAPTLTQLVDWYSVREGIKEDICDTVLDQPAQAVDSSKLPAFGASFVRGVTGNSVDRAFTPQAVAEMAQAESGTEDSTSIKWAFFTSPRRFIVDVCVPGQAEPVRAEMALAGMRWQVKRVWLPEALLKQSHWST